MRGNRGSDTGPERRLRSALHQRGLRFRKNPQVVAGSLRCRPDIVFSRQRVAVFVDGCFWHRCPLHATDPKANSDYWSPKLQANVMRDRRVNEALSREGWLVVRVWEHEPLDLAVSLVVDCLATRGRQPERQGVGAASSGGD